MPRGPKQDREISELCRRIEIARNGHTYAKRQREMEKRAKADAKRARRTKRKEDENNPDLPAATDEESADAEIGDIE